MGIINNPFFSRTKLTRLQISTSQWTESCFRVAIFSSSLMCESIPEGKALVIMNNGICWLMSLNLNNHESLCALF